MQLTQLEYLIAVEKYGSISRAARELYTSQSSISTSIKTLETELGVEVLRRGTKGVHITAEGQYILENANAYPNASSSSRNAFARGAAPR